MKNSILLLGVLFLVNCSKNDPSTSVAETEYVPLKYDTVPVDSFSSGAMSIDVAEQIRRSSLAYQDSIKKVQLRMEEERLAREEKEKQLAAEAEVKKEEEKKQKKLEAEKRKKEQEKRKELEAQKPKKDIMLDAEE